MTQRAKWLGAGGLVVLWLALVYVYFIDVPPPQEVPLKFQSGQVAAAPIQQGSTESWDVKSLHAQVPHELPTTPKRNIFMAASLPLSSEAQTRLVAMRKKQTALASAAAVVNETAPAPPALLPPSPEEIARQQEELAAQVLQQQEELHRKQLLEQMAQYRYLGYVNQKGIQKAFLGKGREIYILRQGDTLDGKFLVALIETTAIKIRVVESKLETTLKLSKDEGSAAGT